MIFANVYEYSSGPHGEYVLYRIYSGDSEVGIKRSIITHVSDSWDDDNNEDMTNAFRSINPSLSISDIAIKINEIINEFVIGSQLHEYDLIIGDPTSDISDCFDFYDDYKEAEANGDNYDGVDLYFYGGYFIEMQKLFPYIYNLIKEYGVRVDSEAFDRMSKVLL
jgi:hypothetical protein